MEFNFERQLHSFSGLKCLFGAIIFTLLVFIGVKGEVISSHPNRHSVLTIVSEAGDIIDCVDIHRQPSLDHPSIKNHTVKWLPSFLPTAAKGNSSRYAVDQLWHKSGICPKETIPILRAPATNLIIPNGEFSYCKVEVMNTAYTHTYIFYRDDDDEKKKKKKKKKIILKYNVARLEMYLKKGEGPYLGATGTINAWDIHVHEREWSLNSVTIFNKQGSFMEIGWAVSPVLFGDQKPRMFVNWWDKTKDRGCFNLRCTGFIQVSSNVMLGSPLPNVSVYDGQQYGYEFSIVKDSVRGIWWAIYQGVPLGYWPTSLFVNFEVIGYANWGGSVCNSVSHGSHTNSEMGSGVFASLGYRRASYVKSILILNKNREFVSPKHSFHTVKCDGCYSVQFCTKLFEFDVGRCIHYGGPGGRYCDAKC